MFSTRLFSPALVNDSYRSRTLQENETGLHNLNGISEALKWCMYPVYANVSSLKHIMLRSTVTQTWKTPNSFILKRLAGNTLENSGWLEISSEWCGLNDPRAWVPLNPLVDESDLNPFANTAMPQSKHLSKSCFSGLAPLRWLWIALEKPLS